MALDFSRSRKLLTEGKLRTLFIEELGWDRQQAAQQITAGPWSRVVIPLAQKRGMVAYQCPTPDGERIPDYAQRRKIEQQVGKVAHEHLIVFTDSNLETQIWQWVKREAGKPAACREHTFRRGQPGDALLQKLDAIAFTLTEEGALTLMDVTHRTRSGFDVERVTKRFYDRFQKEHGAFLTFIDGITDRMDHEWYASVMLNRLMFVYFIQRKGFLAGDPHYLRNRLTKLHAEHGKDKFYSFYRYFLLRLFHEGLGAKQHSPELERLVGRIPYLNGGIFDVHELERSDRYGDVIQIPDEAFQRIFDYFDQYQWHLDERPLRADNEINPDVLGYIFEKYINQKQMGAYYTKEDITEYIAKNTVVPSILDATRASCEVAFANPNGPTVWDLLSRNPDRYVYAAVGHGVHEALPRDIALGLKPETLTSGVVAGSAKTLTLRECWNRPAPGTHALIGETWREVIGRRSRYENYKAKLVAGEVRDVDKLITFNLDIRQFAQDLIENCEGPDFLRAIWNAIGKVTILDPTCGSGAFLFAALNILEPLYEACLDRMEGFIGDVDRSGDSASTNKFNDFRQVLRDVADHPNRRYFILKSIILQNLFGVDIMEEAVEICKLRLFLKLAAQVEPQADRENYGIEPLPDIDFNIRAGNTLVGYTTLDEVKRTLGSKFDFDKTLQSIASKAATLQEAFDAFRARQIEGDGVVPAADKKEVGQRLTALVEELNQRLAGEYGVAASNRELYSKWHKSHQPFHWFVEFYGVVHGNRGFDVIVGNPPYVEYKDVKKHYSIKQYDTEPCENLFAYCWERAVILGMTTARIGLIIPVASVCTDGYSTLQNLWVSSGNLVVSNFNDRPGKLFDGLEHIRLAIVLLAKTRQTPRTIHTTTYNKWTSESRTNLFPTLAFARTTDLRHDGSLPKVGSQLEATLLEKVSRARRTIEYYVVKSGRNRIYYTRKLSWFVQVLDFVPSITDGKNAKREPSELQHITVASVSQKNAFLCALNSTLFYWLLTVWSDCRNLNKREVLGLPIDYDNVSTASRERLDVLAEQLTKNVRATSKVVEMNYTKWGLMKIQCIYPRHSKAILDQIDLVLGEHFGFTEEELDFIINFDIKYRLGRDHESEQDS